MGIIWRSAMPLLTTLAALVIIVHCVEEDLGNEYSRHDLRPRILDPDSSNNDQIWRAIEDDPGVIHQPRNVEGWDDVPQDEPPKRRRPGRKRKRRPPPVADEEIQPQERFAYPDEPARSYYDVDSETRQTTQMPGRRRKKPEARPIRWTDDEVMVVERPLRRRALERKKRPSIDAWPELSEFRLPANKPDEDLTDHPRDYNSNIVQSVTPQANIEAVFEHDGELMRPRTKRPKFHNREHINVPAIERKELNREANAPDDKSLSDFSPETYARVRDTNIETEGTGSSYSKYLDKTSGAFSDREKSQDHHPKELSLKDILKRSNGTSLSEILQQHNLSLADLLHGKEEAVSIFKNLESIEAANKNTEVKDNVFEKAVETKAGSKEKEESEQTLINSETKYVRTEPVTETYTTTEISQTVDANKSEDEVQPSTTTIKPLEENVTKMTHKRRFPTGLRKKLRMRPMQNVTNTYKGQLSRDLIALNARKYSHRRNTTKSREWKDVLPAMRQKPHKGKTLIETTTMAIIPEETTILTEVESINNPIEEVHPPASDIETKLDDIEMDETESTASVLVTEITTETPINCTEKPIAVVTMARPTAVSTGLRRQAFNNRLKRKRLKHRNSTTESPQDDIIKHLFGMGDLVSSSEFIARTQEPKTTIGESQEFTNLEDFMTTESTVKNEAHLIIKTTTTKHTTTPKSIIQSTTEESAKIEIEEIFNDTQTSAKLSRILRERNMTLSELVEHRERGSSHVHLADIFHNASREPNPPEPFLSKSLLEPISKETYPLRALLDANLHDPNGKVTTIDPNLFNNNIPVVMDYGNNVNENAENMGIMSLFNNFTKNITKSIVPTEPEEVTTALPEIVQNVTKANDTVREGRVMGEIHDDVVSWNEIFSLMGRTRNNDTEEFASNQPFKKITLEEDADGDGLLVLEDLQHLKDFENNIASASGSDEELEVTSFERHDRHHAKGILDKIPSQTKSVTVATASIAGLAMILFLLTYAAFKWKQQRSMIRKKRTLERDERIPTPVFENRKGHKNHSSTRSMSPMLQTSNIYTLNTLDSQNGKESPDYMWDSLRKPFQ